MSVALTFRKCVPRSQAMPQALPGQDGVHSSILQVYMVLGLHRRLLL